VIKKILFAADFVSTASKAEAYIVELAKATQAAVTVFHALEPIEDAQEDTAIGRFVDRKRILATKTAEGVATRLREHGLSCDVAVEIGTRWKAILDHAQSGAYDLIVIGAHNIEDGDKIYMGTTTQKVFFSTKLPLLVVPE
jgi:nucleotide-binding universal stress UspA family protein